MLLTSKTTKHPWTKRDVEIISKYKSRIRDLEQLNLEQKILHKDINSIDFYSITPKQQLPKFLQKMQFQTLHSKQNVSKVVKIFKKQRQTPQEKAIRNKLRNQGEIMFLSEMYFFLINNFRYQNLAEPAQQLKSIQNLGQISKFVQNFGTDLQQWQKTKNSSMIQKLQVLRRRNPNHQSQNYKQSRIIEQKLSQLNRHNSTGRVVNYFKQGSNYKKEIEKQLDIIYYTHSSEPNQVNKYILIENSSKLLKKELDERQLQVQEEIKSKMKILNETRIQHHHLFEQKARLMLEERQYHDELLTKEQYGIPMSSANSTYFSTNTNNKIMEIKTQKRQHIEQNEVKIMKNKRMIQNLENAIQNSEDQLRSIMVGEISYYKMTLKVGMDCRDTGLGWVLKKLRALLINTRDKDSTQQTSPHSAHNEEEYQFPLYLDKKSKEFLIVKTHLEDQLEQLMEQKRKFVNQIGQSQQSNGSSSGHQDTPNSKSAMNRTITINAGNGGWVSNSNFQDKIVEDDNSSDIPKKYRKSLRKITILNQEFAKNQSLLEFKTRILNPSKNLDLSTNTDGLSGKRLYETITQKIKFFDFTKAKKDKSLALKNSKLLEYQNLLKLIKEIHMKLEDLDIQHENHLTSHYKENKEVFFQQCAACFGYKKSYSMIIKYFSWKSAGEEGGNLQKS